jgi:hypothetical protein
MSKAYKVGNISSVPEHKGVYAWYLRPQLSTYDIKNLIKKIDDNIAPSEKLVEDFLNKYIFYPLKETPYGVKIEGKLKPKYKGEIAYSSPSSRGLISRISKNPKLLFDLKKVFESVQHDFLSPIYIGMAKNLKIRLCNHVNLMKKIRESEASSHYEYLLPQESCYAQEVALDHKFAQEVVVQRKLDINDLEVHILELEFTDDIHVDIENIFNRINYPLCGRN